MTETLRSFYRDPSSDLFLTPDIAKLFAAAKKEAALSTLTYADIQAFKTQVETIARNKAEKRLKPGTKRYSYRKYRFFGNDIVAGDLAFIPRLQKGDPDSKDKNKRPGILAIFLCCHSRMVSMNFQPDATAKSTLASFQKSLAEDFAGKHFAYFLSDRGYVFCFVIYPVFVTSYLISSYLILFFFFAF